MNRKYLYILLSFLFIDTTLFAQNKYGFVQQETMTIAIKSKDSVFLLSATQKQTTRVYLDGLGRATQSIALQASPLGRDIIQPIVYDNLGRQTKSYLPYAGQSTDTVGLYRNTALAAQATFYTNTNNLVARDDSAFAQTMIERSPLQRLLRSGMTGSGFQLTAGQHYKRVKYRFNNSTADGNILIWNPDGTFTASNYYPDNKLRVTDGLDEDQNETLAFTDLNGQLILKRQKLGSTNLDTYYIYNTAGMLSYILPPKAITTMILAGSYSLTVTGVSKLYFRFIYDTKGRLIEKIVPAKGRMSIVYDPLGRVVLTQDSNMNGTKKWAYIKYDLKGRAISQGVYTNTTYTTRSAMQGYVNTLSTTAYYTTNWYESRSVSANTTGYYTNNAFPNTNITPLGYSYYDNYNLNGTPYTYANAPTGEKLPGETGATTAALRGVPTMSQQLTVGGGVSSPVWLLKLTFYDRMGNPVQTRSNNHMYTGAGLTDTSTNVPDFTGVPKYAKVVKRTGASTYVKVRTDLSYDPMYRLTNIDQYYNGSSTVNHIAAYSYNELGQGIKKGLGYVNATTYLQSLDMRYNIRGQLLSINNSKLASDTGKTNSDNNDVFGMRLLYDKTDSQLGNTAYYNGKLSAVKWMSKDASGTAGYERAFRYYYDAAGRDTAAIYAERTTASTSSFITTHGWDENRITYDPNGNILSMFRQTATQGTGGHTPIDNLVYNYDANNPNQLKTVTDGTSGAYLTDGFRNLTSSAGNYTYDGNGNLVADPYKGITKIAFNALSRPDTVRISSTQYITYTYDSGGTLIRKMRYASGQTTLVTDYIDGFVYDNSSGATRLAYFPRPEGRVLYNGSSFTQEFTITDQQGNARVSFNNAGTGGTAKVTQENSYYAFGMVMPGSNVTGNGNKNLYNGGSEWQNDYSNVPDYYQTFYRNYDAAIGRWTAVDPVAESLDDMSPYQYAGNNPIMMNDPMGDLLPLPGSKNAPPEQAIPSQYAQPGRYHVFGSNSNTYEESRSADPIGDWSAANWAAHLEAQDRILNHGAIDSYATLFTSIYRAIRDGGSGDSYYEYNTLGDPFAFNSTSSMGKYSWNVSPVVNHRVLIKSPFANQEPESGTLDVFDLLHHYEYHQGQDYTLTQATFDQFVYDMFAEGKLNYDQGTPVPKVKGLYQVVVNTHGTEYYNSVGLATLYYNKTGFVGYSDWWNFDPKAWGTRSFWGEVATRYGSTLIGQPFMVIYGITPPKNDIPRH